ncbi:MAG: FISUMP domain-containing protein [Bacteroidota bacterium]
MNKKYFAVSFFAFLISHQLVSQNTISDIDGNQYNTVTIGEQEWMAENLRVTRYRNGDEILFDQGHNVWQQSVEGIWTYYDEDENNDQVYGKLYNWYAVSDNRGLCPVGWRIPTDADWQELVGFIDPKANGNNNKLGTRLRSKRQVNSPLGDPWDTEEHPRWDSHGKRYGTDDYGFNAIPGGSTSMGNAFVHKGRHSYFWSLDEQNENTAWARVIRFSHRGMSRTAYFKQLGFSVRCIKGEDLEPQISAPGVRIVELEEVGTTEATVKSSITDNGGSAVTARGLVWGTSTEPTLENNSGFTEDGTGWSMFTSNATGLSSETTYFFRAYATNSAGTNYSGEVEIETVADINIDECMVAYFPFNGNANDESGNTNHGVVNGAQLTTDRFGNEESAYYFDGNNSHITIPGNLPSSNNLSISFWALMEKESGTANIISDGSINIDGNDFLINFNQNDIGIRADKGGNNLNYEYSSPLELSNLELKSNWVHVVWVLEEGNSFVYLNGEQIAELSIKGSNEGYHDPNVTVGARHVWTNMDNFFKGKLDQIRFYNCPISDEMVEQIYYEEKPESLTTYNLDISVNPDNAGNVEGSGAYNVGDEIELTATPNEGYQFLNWTLDDEILSTESTFTYTMPASDVTLVANFEPIAPAQNNIIVMDASGNAGDIITITVEMENSDAITAFQMDFELPEGFQYVEESFTLTERMAGHEQSESVVANNTLRILAWSNNNAIIEGNEGTLFTFDIGTPHQEGSWELTASNVNLTNTQLENVFNESIPGTITLAASNTGDHTIQINDATGNPGSDILIEVEMNNLTDITAFQMDIELPEGFEYVDGSYTLSDRSQGHASSHNLLENNVLRLVGYSLENEVFLGDTGVLLTFMLTSPDTEGEYPLTATNVNLTNTGFENVFDGVSDGMIGVVVGENQ